ncbi:lysophospholipid acyltransferase family protein [Owenweeksia hongkongensis]|uniref:lysophospholipid acyltransferase family protein n=1 Tax=Owenweeksia hongkongensis TaxID=253245 RepID=UPI003A908E41
MIGYYLAVAFGWLISILPFRILYIISDFISFVMQHIFKYRKEVIMGNLSKAFPVKSENELNRIRFAFYRNFADLIVESFKSLTISEKTLRKRFKLNNPELFEKLYAKDKGVLLVMGHYTNFEWTAMSMPLLVPHPSFAVYQPLNNKRFSRKVVSIREQFGLELYSMNNTYPFMLNNPVKAPLYIFMADQSPHKGKIKYYTEFLNQNTPVHLGVENLAKKCDLAVVFIDIQRVKRGFYEVTAHLLFEDVKNTEPYEVTNTHVKALEKVIKKKPEDWLWSHRRWKHARN